MFLVSSSGIVPERRPSCPFVVDRFLCTRTHSRRGAAQRKAASPRHRS